MGTLAYYERALKLKRCDFTFWGAAPDPALAGRQPPGMIKTHPRQLPGAWVPYRVSRGFRGKKVPMKPAHLFHGPLDTLPGTKAAEYNSW
jgi:hypothetical protein